MRRRAGIAILSGVAACAAVAVMMLPRIPQDPAYHVFADTESRFGIDNFLNVITNAAFVLAGVYGWSRLPRAPRSPLRPSYVVLCTGVLLVGFGSAFYHLAPSNATLAWDRAPMTVAFMALFALVVGDCVSERFGARMLWPLILAGLASVAYWRITEQHGQGDLRPYVLVQFLPMLLLPLVLVLFGTKRLSAPMLWCALFFYAASKVAEYFDAAIFGWTGFMSGHSVKHLLAAAAVLAAMMAFKTRDA